MAFYSYRGSEVDSSQNNWLKSMHKIAIQPFTILKGASHCHSGSMDTVSAGHCQWAGPGQQNGFLEDCVPVRSIPYAGDLGHPRWRSAVLWDWHVDGASLTTSNL